MLRQMPINAEMSVAKAKTITPDPHATCWLSELEARCMCREHFKLKKKAVLDMCSKWLGKNDGIAKSIKAELDKLA